MTTQTRNEAAERLLLLIQAEHGPDFEPVVDEALAAESRATVERIRAAVNGYKPDILTRSAVSRILDEEAAR